LHYGLSSVHSAAVHRIFLERQGLEDKLPSGVLPSLSAVPELR
jgi:hypothetical protein